MIPVHRVKVAFAFYSYLNEKKNLSSDDMTTADENRYL